MKNFTTPTDERLTQSIPSLTEAVASLRQAAELGSLKEWEGGLYDSDGATGTPILHDVPDRANNDRRTACVQITEDGVIGVDVQTGWEEEPGAAYPGGIPASDWVAIGTDRELLDELRTAIQS